MALQNKINLITYPDSMGSNLLELHYVLRRYLTQVIGVFIFCLFTPRRQTAALPR
jgi:sucrose phosphorylase